jgi:hypothetical protein
MKNLFALTIFVMSTSLAYAKPTAGLQDPFQVEGENQRGQAHYEVLIMNRNTEGLGGAGHYYNSLGLSFDLMLR